MINTYGIQQQEALMSRYTMDDVLKDETLFREKFCADVTLRNLGAVPVEALQKSIQMIHACSGFRAAATPDHWNREEQPVIVFGRPTIAGSMNAPKFGLTTHVKISDGLKGTKLFFWITETAQRKIQQSNKHLDLRCRATNRMRIRIASPTNVPE